jgi:HEAT repeat protein
VRWALVLHAWINASVPVTPIGPLPCPPRGGSRPREPTRAGHQGGAGRAQPAQPASTHGGVGIQAENNKKTLDSRLVNRGTGGPKPRGSQSSRRTALNLLRFDLFLMRGRNYGPCRVLVAVSVTGSLALASHLAGGSIWPNATERVAKQLRSPNPTTRRGAADKLGELPRAVARRLLLNALVDPDPDVRVTAAALATDWRVTEAGASVVSWLGDPDARLRVAAAVLLRVAPSESALGGLGRALGDPDQELRAAAAAALGGAGPGAAVILLGHLDDPAPKVRESVVAALGEVGDSAAVLPLVGKIQDGQPAVRRAVVRALGGLGDPRATGALVLALRDGDETVRVSAVDALGRLGAPEGATALGALLKSDASESVRKAAARGLGRIRSREAIEALIEVLGDPVLDASAERSLLELGASSIPRLEPCLGLTHPGPNVSGCVRVLARLRAPHGLSLIQEVWRRGGIDPEVALGALGDLGDSRALPLLLERLADPEARVRRAAMEALAQLLQPEHPDGRAVQPIQTAMSRTGVPAGERRALAALLGRTGSRAAAPLLGALAAGSGDVRLRVVSLEALGRLGPVGQDDVLLAALGDERPTVRLAAAVALRSSASAKAAEILLDRIGRAPEEDRTLAILALSGALGRTRDSAVVSRTLRLLTSAREGERDALIEALGRARVREVTGHLVSLAGRGGDGADRAKAAEALSAHPEALKWLRRLARDPDGSVRANAVWGLGSQGTGDDLTLLRAALRDPDVSVAANAAASLGRVAARLRIDVTPTLCGALEDGRSYVRTNSLGALALLGRRCDDGTARRLLGSDPADVVRRSAAWLLWRVPGQDARVDMLARLRCQDEDRSGEVAAACTEPPRLPGKLLDPVTVYVVRTGEASPAPRTPFALVRSDGLVRLGVTDRRGAVFEHDVPRGQIQLGALPSSTE